MRVREVAQRAMDQFYKQFKTNSDFFGLDDFVARVGGVVADFYFQLYREKYAEIRADGNSSAEVVQFDPLHLNEQILEVDKKGFAEYKYPVMSFVYDQQSVGVQEVLDDKTGEEVFRRTSKIKKSLLPHTDRAYYRVKKKGLEIITDGCKVERVAVAYIPAVSNEVDWEVPDVLVENTIIRVVASMRELDPGLVKKTNDQNQNMAPETEINKNSLK